MCFILYELLDVCLDRMDGVIGVSKGTTENKMPRESIEDFLNSCGDSYSKRKSNAKAGKKRVSFSFKKYV